MPVTVTWLAEDRLDEELPPRTLLGGVKKVELVRATKLSNAEVASDNRWKALPNPAELMETEDMLRLLLRIWYME
jgi:hypothetical protein